jgi:DnaJ-class molecular chaperone
MTERDYYKVLQVDPEADADVIAAAHGALAAKLRPDTDLTGVHQVRMAELDRAYAVLSDPARRRTFDEHRQQMVAMGPGLEDGNGHTNGNGHDELPRFAHGALTERVQAGYNGSNVATMTLDFGRFAGWTLSEIARQDPDYLRWLSRHSSGIRYRGAILKLLSDAEANRQPLHVQR